MVEVVIVNGRGHLAGQCASLDPGTPAKPCDCAELLRRRHERELADDCYDNHESVFDA